MKRKDTEKTVKRDGILRGALVLSVCALGAKVLGALFRIPLTNIIGAEGMGLYQLVFPVFALLLTFCSGGITVTVSRMTAECRARGEKPSRVLAASGAVVAALSLLGAAILFLCAPYIAAAQGNPAASGFYRIISAAVVFAGGIAFFKGWAQGYMNTLPSGVATLTEQAVKLAAGLSFANLLLPRGVESAVAGAIAGIVLSEAVALVAACLSTLFAVRKANAVSKEPDMNLLAVGGGAEGVFPAVEPEKKRFSPVLKSVLKTWGLVTIGALLVPLSQFIDSFLIINLLKGAGASVSYATAQYGVLSAPVASLVNLPIVLSISLAAVIVPAVSKSRAAMSLDGVLKKSALSVKVAYTVGVPATFLFFVFAESVLALLYPAIVGAERALAVRLLRVLCFEILFMSGVQIYTALLQALDKTSVPVRIMAVAVVLKVVLTLVLVPRIGVGGSAVASLVMAIFAWTGDTVYVSRYLGVNAKFLKNIAEILSSGVIMLSVAILFAAFCKNGNVAFFVGAPVSVCVYIVALWVSRAFDGEELSELPIVGRFAARRQESGRELK